MHNLTGNFILNKMFLNSKKKKKKRRGRAEKKREAFLDKLPGALGSGRWPASHRSIPHNWLLWDNQSMAAKPNKKGPGSLTIFLRSRYLREMRGICLFSRLSLLAGRLLSWTMRSPWAGSVLRLALCMQVASVPPPWCPPFLFRRVSAQHGAAQDPEHSPWTPKDPSVGITFCMMDEVYILSPLLWFMKNHASLDLIWKQCGKASFSLCWQTFLQRGLLVLSLPCGLRLWTGEMKNPWMVAWKRTLHSKTDSSHVCASVWFEFKDKHLHEALSPASQC